MVRDNEVIDAELRLLTAVCRCIHSLGGHPSTTHIDALLDERTHIRSRQGMKTNRPRSR